MHTLRNCSGHLESFFFEWAILNFSGAEKELKAMRQFARTYRAEATYAVTSGKWYFEFEVLTAGFMKVGWMDIGAPPDTELGLDDRSYGFDGSAIGFSPLKLFNLSF